MAGSMSLADGAPRGLHVRRPGRLWLATLAGSVAIHLAALPLLARLVPALPWPSSLVVQLISAPAASPDPAPAAAARERARRAEAARSAAAARAAEREREAAAHARAQEAEEARRAEAARE